ncbi:MAG TPA: metalloregulator ArsR/SmtB family transcription factor [Vicinamibacterales bacterium]|nr:metalloregulator ArsR/SmtB family transcription factor [Vicinamibacterales bacterium]
MLEQHALRSIGSPRRREILRLVWRQELSAGSIHRAMPDVTFGAVSLHLRVLDTAGLVESRKEGRRRFYRARPGALGEAAGWLERMWDDALWQLKLRAELDETRRGPRSGRRPRRPASAKD